MAPRSAPIQQIPQIVPGLPEVHQMTRGRAATEGGARSQQQVASDVTEDAGNRRLGRPRHHGVSRRDHRQPPATHSNVPDSGIDHRCRWCLPWWQRPSLTWTYPAMFFCGLLDRRPAQLLGQLPATRLSDPPARNRRELCRQHRRPARRNLVRVDHRDFGGDLRIVPMRRPRSRSSPPRSRSRCTLIGFIASFWLPEPQQEELPD